MGLELMPENKPDMLLCLPITALKQCSAILLQEMKKDW